MDEERDRRRSSDDARWRQICLRFHDLCRDAREFGLSDRFDALARDPVGDLAGWLELREQIRLRKEHALGVAMPKIDLAAELDWQGILHGADRPGRYVCPGDRCSREERALFGEPPLCDLLDRKMIEAGGRSA